MSESTLLTSTVNGDAALVRSFVNLVGLTPTDLDPTARSAQRASDLGAAVGVLAKQGQILRVAILSPTGQVLAAGNASTVGATLPVTASLSSAVASASISASIVPASSAEAGELLPADTVLREYLPVSLDGRVRAVVAVWRDAGPILAQLDASRFAVVGITLAAAAVSALLLILIFRSAQTRLSRQGAALLEATRRDALTGALNHGAVVERLAGALDRGRDVGGGVGVALLDIDNFGLLNDTHGHAAGDEALLEVARLLSALPQGIEHGRYGPDEFLVIATGGAVAGLEPALERLRAVLADVTLRFEASERLPVTLSVGMCFSPTNGESATTLLSIATLSLEEAKSSGGDAIRVADAKRAVSPSGQTFDVFQGLVIAVDTKDRYTRRHSEDVARYVDFIAEQLDLDATIREVLHTAGLLHDVGKIGIPDALLRKPDRLTEAESTIVQQHVALGDMIVRDLPNIELVRAGIRHHHERWDGTGYLDRLAADEIPLVARILAVGDAFSAMTTTRPYRKSLPTAEALKRLEDAAGSQLDERFVRAFVDGIRSAADPPLPGMAPPARIWTPNLRVA
jgi:diguanylate cyclase (GGDEF)-like protein